MKLISKKDQIISTWSGGTTTQLFIYPPEATYVNRDFVFRISTATVETDTSTFTSLPGYQRLLMILNGILDISHTSRYSKTLAPFDTDRFDGGWETTAKGKVTDFNIMFADGIQADLTAHQLPTGSSFHFPDNTIFQFGYLVSGNAVIQNNSLQRLQPGDFLIIEDDLLTVIADNDCTLLVITIAPGT